MRFILLMLGSFTVVNIYAQAERKYVRKGNGEYKDGAYQKAEIEYRKALEKNQACTAADYNLGNALYKQKQYDASAEKYAKLAENEKDNKTLNHYYYNLGNSLYESGKYKECVEAYKNALRNDPADIDTKHNLQLALRMLSAQEQKQNKDNQQQDKNQNSDKNKNQQNQKQNDPQADQDQNQTNSNQQTNSGQTQEINGQISRENAERLLQALENEEKNVMKKVQEQKQNVTKVPVEKNW
jgi:Ca-activated chloride channel homolog